MSKSKKIISQKIISDISSQITKNNENANDLLTNYNGELIIFINNNSTYITNLLRKIRLSLENLDELSKIPNIQAKLNKILNLKHVKEIKSNILDNSDNLKIKKLFEIIDNKEAENRLQKLEEEDAKSQQATSVEQVSQEKEQVADAKSTEQEEKAEDAKATEQEEKEKEADTNALFEAKLKEMEAKLPPKLGKNGLGFVDYTQVADKEFCYKFLYCWLNNPSNQKNPNAIKVYNSIIDTYGIEDERFPKLDEKEDTQVVDITFDVGFIIKINVQKGGIPTQKRRPNKPKKRNHTIKDRVRVKTR